ncbi:hypothetical protein OCU04_005686 [Sclerotinia nivalis]|uniref:Uncharacterized protein n=1 Tax=Sclerotinia nivalis TaxID=352851 RepID=A0A9X0AQL1_9HELO|nr:hypothetical protein OCU04_005686 [Sclerotinia nivalis]
MPQGDAMIGVGLDQNTMRLTKFSQQNFDLQSMEHDTKALAGVLDLPARQNPRLRVLELLSNFADVAENDRKSDILKCFAN